MSVTQEDVAARAGVSRALVSLVMRESPRVSASKREAVLRAAGELGYTPNAHAAQLASRRTMTLGLVVMEMQNPLMSRVIQAAEDRAEEAGYGVSLAVGDMDPAVERRAVNRLLGRRVDGLILAASRLPSDEIRDLAAQVPVLVAGRRVNGVDTVAVDDRSGARLAVEHLINLGHKRIAHIDGGDGPGAQIRQRAYRQTLEAHGLPAQVPSTTGGYTERGGIAAAQELLEGADSPTAIFAANDLSALGALAVAKDMGLRVPADLSVVGFDNTPLSQLQYVNLTSVNQPGPDIGILAVATLVGRIDDPEQAPRTRLLTPELRVRRTTAAPSGR
ncbi:LacI family DNA-binding transcriptional regulator [Pedococcus sp. 5OH_020]|uniref:LacI family DNA-binding transcriptional regulator n=1 Tax=Pedococcus sp. 5OH_020 TaxID=2989814 RepID=UPI0022EA0B1D|nr:LacI family DNA-binding transcriptional regulator [Pedococcus sp. 5OH_020]